MADVLVLGEGGSSGQLKASESIVFAAVEVCLCLLTRQMPNINPVGGKNPTSLLHLPSQGADSKKLIAAALNAMSLLPELCSPQGSIFLQHSLQSLHKI
jgi:HEAT repeat-containing protein 5